MATDGYVSSHLATLKAKDNILDDRFLFYFSSTIDSRNLMQDQNYPSLRLSDIQDIDIFLPSFHEQKRIVKVLDGVFEKIAKAKENAENNLQNSRELFESYLQSVFANKVDGWGEKTLGDLYEITSSKRVFKAEWKSNGVPFYRAREIVKLAQQGFVDNELFISEEMYNQYSVKYGIPKEGDIMVTGVGTLGICYVVKNDDKFYFKDGNIIWLKRESDVNSRYVEYAFKSDFLRKQIDNSIGATVGTYTIIKAKNTKIPLPPLLEQQCIVQKLDALLAETKKLEAIYQQKLGDLEELKKSILQKAFKGELIGVQL
jgi:type I restriction enzyme S subunit